MQVVCDYGMWVIGMGAIARRGHEAWGPPGKQLEPSCLPLEQGGCWLDKRKQLQVSDVSQSP